MKLENKLTHDSPKRGEIDIYGFTMDVYEGYICNEYSKITKEDLLKSREKSSSRNNPFDLKVEDVDRALKAIE